MIPQDLVRLGAETLSAVLEEDPIDTTRFAAVANPITTAQQKVPQTSEGVERFCLPIILAVGEEKRVLETVPHETPVRERSRQAIEISCHDGRETVLLEFHYLAED